MKLDHCGEKAMTICPPCIRVRLSEPLCILLRRLLSVSGQLVIAWYLLTAPYAGPRQNREIDALTPLSKWQILACYDSESECLAKQRALFEPLVPEATPNTIRCVPSDDKHVNLGASLPKAERTNVP
jgi:hypothetical protein